MAFPTIPTVADNRILFALATNPAGTHTSPSLTTLNNQSGDLLIAICILYDGNSTNAEFSAWGGGFTEFADQAGTATMAIGAAYKWSDGTETGTFTVTTADTSSNDSCFILLSIPGANLSTPPEAGTMATGTAPDVGSLNPSGWGTEDTLWIAVGGSGETSTGGAYTGITSAPTNYSATQALSAASADAAGAVMGGVGFRQLNAASEDPGAWTMDTTNAIGCALLIAVRPQAPTTTSVARMSLTSLDTPATRTAHSLKIRARTTAGAGTMRAALYEGASNRSGDLESSALTTSLADYTLAISDANAANIVDYSGLEVRIWGYAAAGGAIVFEVDQVYLETPEGVHFPRHSVTTFQDPGLV